MISRQSSVVSINMSYYPINLDLRNRKCIVIGGGEVAERKIESLLEFGAAVTVIAPDLTTRLSELASAGAIEHIAERYTTGMLQGAILVIAATDDAETNKTVSSEAQRLGILINVVDDPDLCAFFVPAMVRRGNLLISVSSSGKSPALARRMREELESHYGPEYGELADLMGELRDEVKAKYPDQPDRNMAYIRILDSDALSLLRQGKRDEAMERARKCI